jgi:hypothetical protein
MIIAGVKADREQHAENAPTVGFIIFTGAYEVWHDLEQGEERLEELLDSGMNRPTIVKVELSENDGSDVLGLTARKVINASSKSKID